MFWLIIGWVFFSAALGQGWRLGFLGLLHMEVFNHRLEQEYGAEVIVTVPSVPYTIRIFGEKNIKKYGSNEITVNNPAQFPDPSIVEEYLEPIVLGTIITPGIYCIYIYLYLFDLIGFHCLFC